MDPNLLNRYPPPNPRGSGHRRAQSETHFRLPELDDDDNLLLLSDFDLDFPETGPTKSDLESGPEPPPSTGPHHHSRSFSFDDGLGFHPRQHHHHKRSGSMDDGDSSTSTISKEKLAELALVDPKRAKRILANRQSAARSKERKIKYTGELERKMQTLQTEATTLSAQLTLLQRDTTGLTAENRELKLRLQAMEQQAHLRDALNEALREEVQRLKIATGQIPNTNGNAFNRSLQHSTTSPFFSRPQLMTNSNTHQVQQLHNSQSQTPPSQPFGDDSMDFM